MKSKRLERSKLLHCQKCGLGYQKRAYLEKHEALCQGKAVHLPSREMMVKLAAGASTSISVRPVDGAVGQTLSNSGRYVMINNSEKVIDPRAAGYARREPRKGKARFTAGQLEYLEWCYTYGLRPNSSKLTAELAAKHMRLRGTREGQQLYPGEAYWAPSPDGRRTFRLPELLDWWRIKPWFSQQKQAFEKKVASARKGAVDIAQLMSLQGEEEEDYPES